MMLKPIRTESDYQAALREIEQRWDAEPGTSEGDELDILLTLVEAYEKDHYDLPAPDPIAALEYFMESRGWTRKQLEPYIGSRGRVSEVLSRKRPLTLPMIRRLERATGIPGSILIQPYRTEQDEPASHTHNIAVERPPSPNVAPARQAL